MDPDVPDLKRVNVIAYNADIRNRLKTLHAMLGSEVTDVATDAMQFSVKLFSDANDVIKYMSKMASDFSVALIKARASEDNLTADELEDYEKIRVLTGILGNLQYELSKIVKLTNQSNELNTKIEEEGNNLAEMVVNAQEKFRETRISMNAFGYLSHNPDLANLFNMQNEGK